MGEGLAAAHSPRKSSSCVFGPLSLSGSRAAQEVSELCVTRGWWLGWGQARVSLEYFQLSCSEPAITAAHGGSADCLSRLSLTCFATLVSGAVSPAAPLLGAGLSRLDPLGPPQNAISSEALPGSHPSWPPAPDPDLVPSLLGDRELQDLVSGSPQLRGYNAYEPPGWSSSDLCRVRATRVGCFCLADLPGLPACRPGGPVGLAPSLVGQWAWLPEIMKA